MGAPRAALEAEIVARDTFLARASGGLERRVAAVEDALEGVDLSPAAREALAALTGFTRELALIAQPDKTPPVDSASTLELVSLLEELFTARAADLARLGRSVELTRSGEAALIRSHREDVHLVLMELMSNAVKHGNGPIRVHVATTAAWVDMTIRDGGPGVPRAARRRVFGRFVRGVGLKKNTGFGVGLWLVRKIARAYGGDVRLAEGAISVRWPRSTITG
ncbi:MAG: ATP-binding protein [Polyangiaceae bacterium]